MRPAIVEVLSFEGYPYQHTWWESYGRLALSSSPSGIASNQPIRGRLATLPAFAIVSKEL